MKQSAALIVKVTDKCNMKCTFCSASNLQRHDMTVDQICNVIDRINSKNYVVTSISFEGGDPLTLTPQYYQTLFDVIETRYPQINDVAMTTNLWAFYKNPQRWADVLRYPKLDVCTSFQYGGQRRVSDKLILTEDIFVDIITKYNALINDTPPFISVIDESNQHTVGQLIELAKKLNTTCKINPVLPQGRSSSYYPLYKIIQIWTDIIVSGNSQYENNSEMLLDIVKNGVKTVGSCVFAHNCNTIFACDNFGNLSMCSVYRDYNTPIKFYTKDNIADPKQNKQWSYLKPQCLCCELFHICNGCRVHIGSTKQYDDVEVHCQSVQQSIQRIHQFINDQQNH